MKKFLRKFLIYLVMTMMVTPTWLVTGMLGAERAKAAEEPVLESYTVSPSVISPRNADGINDSAEIDLEFSAPVSVDLSIINTLGVLVADLYHSDSVTDPKVKEWTGRDGEGLLVNDGVYTVNVSYSFMSDDEVPTVITKENKVKTITVDNGQPGIVSFLDGSVVLKAGQAGTFPIVFSEPMNTSVDPDVILGEGLAEAGFQVTGSWFNNTTYKLNYVVPSSVSTSVAPAKIMVNGAIDLAGNISTEHVSNGSVSIDVDAPKARIVAPVEFDSVNGTEKIIIEANEDFSASNSIRMSRDDAHWITYVPGVTTIKDVVGFQSLLDGPFTLYAEVIDMAGNPATSDSKLSIELVKDTKASATVSYSTTNPTNKPVTATLVSDEDLIVLNNEGSNEYTFAENGSFTFEFRDAVGNTGSVTATVGNIVDGVIIESPQITTTVNGKSINISWVPVINAVSYNVYSSPKASGLITELYKGVYTNVGNVTEYILNVADYGDYYVTVTAVDQYGNESSFLTEFTGQKLVSVKAPVVVPAPTPTPVTTSVEEPENVSPPVSVSAPRANAEENKEAVTETPKDDEGEIKGDDSAAEEENGVNWTPWIVLFVLIILAGAATGGYFYWFNGEDEVSAVVREKKVVKKETTPVKEVGKKTNNKKSKRW